MAGHTAFIFRHGLRSHDPSLRKQEFLDGIATTQDQVYMRALAADFFISLLNTVDSWAERTLAEIETWDDLTSEGGKNERGLEIMRQLPVATPEESMQAVAVPPAARYEPGRDANDPGRANCKAPVSTEDVAGGQGQDRTAAVRFFRPKVWVL